MAELLVAEVPELRTRLEEHVAFNEEELLHVFWGEIASYVTKQFDLGDGDIPVRVAAFMDRALQGGTAWVRNLIGVSFTENIVGGRPTPTELAYVETWPRLLRKDADRYLNPSSLGEEDKRLLCDPPMSEWDE